MPEHYNHPLLPPPSQPSAPEIFFGRNEYVSDMANVLASEDNIRLAILGGGGMGKTSTALHILHHSAVKAKYGILWAATQLLPVAHSHYSFYRSFGTK